MSAATLPPDFIAEVLARTPLERLIGRQVKLSRGRGKCPFHQGKSPSFSVHRGRYRCFSCGEAGDAISYTMWEKQLGFVGAVQQLADDAGLELPKQHRRRSVDPAEVAQLAAERAARLAEYQARRAAEEAAERAVAIAEALEIWNTTGPLYGSLGERHLIEQRGIPKPATGWPWCLGWHAARRMIVAALTTPDGTVQAVHRIYLKVDGTNRRDADGAKRKLSRGPMDGAAIRLPGGVGDTLHAEGLETGLSAWIATGNPTLIYAGAVASRMQPQPGRNIVLRDDDPPGSDADKLVVAAIARWTEAGINFVVAQPWPVRRGDKSDFNDLLRQVGVNAVRKQILASVVVEDPADPEIRRCDPPRPLPSATLADVHAYHAGTMLRFYKQSETDEPAPQVQIGGQGGIGKTEAAIRFTREEPKRVAVLVPEHKVLGAELLERYRDAGHDFEPLIGRGNPFDPQPGDLCIEPEIVAEAIKAGQDIAKTCCGTADSDEQCDSFMMCPFQAAKALAAEAKKGIIGAHNHLFHQLPKAVAKDIGRLVIEEDFVQQGVWIFNLTHDSFGAAAIEQWPVLHKGQRDDHQTKKLRWFGAALLKAAEQDGDLFAENMRAVGLRQDDFAEATRLSRRRERKVDMYPGMPLDARRELASAAAINGQIGKLVTLISCAQEIFDGVAPGRITSSTEHTKRGIVRQFTVHTMLKVADWASELPVLVNTSTPQIDVLQQFFPRLEVRTPPAVAAPFAEHRLIIGGFSNYTVEHSPRKQREMNRFLQLEALGEIENGFVGFKRTRDAVAKGVPGIIAMHHGQNAGGDRCRDVGVHTVQDGFRPKTRDLAAQVRAKTGRSPSMAPPEYSVGRVLMVDGTGCEGWPVLRYADPDMQAEYSHVRDGATSQAVARPRGVRRTASNPVRINVLGRLAPQDMVFNSVLQWRDVQPGRLGEMTLRRRVTLNARTMTAMHHDLFPSEKAASNARERFIHPDLHGGDMSESRRLTLAKLRGWVERDRQPWIHVRWQKPGQGHGLESAFCPAAEVDAMRAELVAHFGEPAHWQVEPFTAGRSPYSPSAEDIPTIVTDSMKEPGMPSSPWPVWQAGSADGGAEQPERRPDG